MGDRKKYSPTNPRISVFTERFRKEVEKRGGISATHEITGISRPTVSFWYNGQRTPDAENLIALSNAFDVSVDYLLGLTDVKNRDTTVQSVCDFTGLSEESVEYLHRLRQQGSTGNLKMIDFLLDDARYSRGIGRSVLEAIRFFMEYDDKTQIPKQIHIDGAITDYSRNDGMIRSTAMKLDERIIENAVLEEIKRILIELKSAQRGEDNGKL